MPHRHKDTDTHTHSLPHKPHVIVQGAVFELLLGSRRATIKGRDELSHAFIREAHHALVHPRLSLAKLLGL